MTLANDQSFDVEISPLVETKSAEQQRGKRRNVEECLAYLCELVNSVYNESEAGMWKEDRNLARTNLEELRTMAGAGELFIATIQAGARAKSDDVDDSEEEKIVGCIQCKMLSADAAEFGMLVVDPKHRKKGIGKRLIEFTENVCRKARASTMQLCLLHPISWEQPTKQILKRWYPSLGYVKQEELDFAADYGALANELAGECHFTVYRKTLLEE